MTYRPRVALLGCGWFSCEAHIPALRRLEGEGRIEVVALCARSEASLKRASRFWGGRPLKTFTDYRALLADRDIDLVDIVLPIGLAADAVRAALRAGKHVVSEKPCAPTVADGLSMIADHHALDQPPVWAVAENWRFKESAAIIARHVRSGALGDIHFADFRHVAFTGPDGLGWRGSPDYPGGSLLDSGVHFVALLRQLFGEIASVSATVSQRLPYLPPADSVSALLTFASGTEGTFRVSFASPHADHEPGLTIIGTNGALAADFRRGRIELRGPSGTRSVAVKNDPWIQGGVHALLAHVVDAVSLGVPLRCTPSDALRDVAVIEAMLESSRLQRPVRPASQDAADVAAARLVSAYGDVWRVRPSQVVECASIDEVRSAVRAAAAAGRHVRVIGNGNSWAPHLLSREVCLRLRGFDRIRGLDRDRKTVWAGAGVRLGDLTRCLAAQDLCLPSLSFLADASIGGAVATGTHGTSARWGTLSDFVTAITLVLASGEVRTFRREAEAFGAAIVSVGMLGVIVDVEFQAVDIPFVRYREQAMGLPAFVGDLPALLRTYAHLWVHWTLGTDRVETRGLETRPGPAPGFHRYIVDDNACWARQGAFVRGRQLAGKVLRRAKRVAVRRAPPAPEPSSERTGPQVWMSMQYGVPLSSLEETIDHLRASPFARAHAGRVVEMKFLKGSETACLGSNADGDAVLFNLWWLVDERDKHIVFDAFEALMRGLHAKPHWGKYHLAPDVGDMERAFRRWPDFERVRRDLDPDGVFSIFKPVLRPEPVAAETESVL